MGYEDLRIGTLAAGNADGSVGNSSDAKLHKERERELLGKVLAAIRSDCNIY